MGLRDYGPVPLAGVIANRVASSGHAAMVAASLRDIPLFGTLPRQPASLPERHLGLVLPAEVAGIDTLLDTLAAQLDLDEAAWAALQPVVFDAPAPASPLPQLLAGTTIAVARDAAFMFIYPANLATLRELGASLTFFSPLADEAVPPETHAVYLPGGYPELHAPRPVASRHLAGVHPRVSPGGPAHRRRMRRHDGPGRQLAHCRRH